ncbi:MASE2 domain-containing protein, partial [Pseudomonas syringae group genomosp. 7]|uniref:MASE2 domain-containing protein n=1 Tax=Pseudomonas syringae group genomosp. 7 TaxID=251699 RepID=UPI00376F4C0F
SLAMHNALISPNLANRIEKKSHETYHAEWRNLLFEYLIRAISIGAMGFSAVPSVTVIALMAMHNMAAGGPRLMLQGLCALALGVLISLAVLNRAVNLL